MSERQRLAPRDSRWSRLVVSGGVPLPLDARPQMSDGIGSPSTPFALVISASTDYNARRVAVPVHSP